MNTPDDGLHKGARPKVKPPVNLRNGGETSCNDNNNSRRSLYCDESMSNARVSPGSSYHAEDVSRPCGGGSSEGPSKSRSSQDHNSTSRGCQLSEAATASSSHAQSLECTTPNTISRLLRPSELALNGYCELLSGLPPADFATAAAASNVPEVANNELDVDDFSVLPRELLQNNDCGMNGDCEVCGPKSGSLDRAFGSMNGVAREPSPNDRVSNADSVELEEGAVGGEPEALSGRCSPDSGEGEFENQNSRSPSCSWDQHSNSSEEECFYRYRGEDNMPGNAAAGVDNLPHQNGVNDRRRQSSSPEMDYLEMDFDPSSSDWGGDDGRPPAPVPDPDLLPDPAPPITPPAVLLPLPQAPPVPIHHQQSPVRRLSDLERLGSGVAGPLLSAPSTGDVMLWSQSCATELSHPFTTPLTSASNAIFYTMTASGTSVTREAVVAHLTEHHPPQPIPQTLVGYLFYRASHTPSSSFSQPSLILTGPDLARAFGLLSRGQLRARFFPIQSRRTLESGSLCRHITSWLHRGVVPILTFSQCPSEGGRHEMVFGSSEGGLLTMGEPYRQIPEAMLIARLAGQGRVTVVHSELLSRWSRDQDLRPLVQPNCLAWATANILGSVVGMLRDATVVAASPSPSSPCNSRQPQPQPSLSLPLLCESGVTLVCDANSPNRALIDGCSYFDL